MKVSERLSDSADRMARVLRRMAFDNRRFWNDRYVEDPDKGSGPGSRGGNLLLKSSLIYSIINHYKIKTVLDIGCGDIAVLGSLAIDSYMGVDISNVIIERNKLARPQWQFVCADLTGYYRPPSADLVLCFDVLIHQRSRAHYLVILAKILGATERIALISGYSKRDPGWNVFFHEPITESIQRLVPAARIKKLAEYRGTDLIKVELTRESGSDLKSGNE